MKEYIFPHLISGKATALMERNGFKVGGNPPTFDSDTHIFLLSADALREGAGLIRDIELPPSRIGLPFRSCWFEAADDCRSLLQTELGGDRHAWLGALFTEKEWGIEGQILVHHYGKKECFWLKCNLGWDSAPADSQMETVDRILRIVLDNALRKTNQVGEINLPRQSLARRQSSKPHLVKKLIYICRSRASSPQQLLGYPIAWKHSWEVMGHWRTVPTIGKDRQGNYVVPGRTWVAPHERGEGPLIHKTRLVQ